MNEEMNNNYEKNNSGVKVLLIILIILVLCLIGLVCYKMFIYDKKNDNNVVEKLNINDVEVQKYYNFVSSNGRLGGYESYDYEYLIKNKNLNAYNKIIFPQAKLGKNQCVKYSKYIVKNPLAPDYPYGCFDFDNPIISCNAEQNNSELTMVSTILDIDMKDAVEKIYGKGTYEAYDFTINPSIHFQYVEEEKKYILLNNCGGGFGPTYITKLIGADKIANKIFIYEGFADQNDVDATKYTYDKLVVKHIFEKNTYDNNYHYVKTEKA